MHFLVGSSCSDQYKLNYLIDKILNSVEFWQSKLEFQGNQKYFLGIMNIMLQYFKQI